jgi:EAL domain-containing protein (putative c-di-GMP-specific phosphodiesterase class I)
VAERVECASLGRRLREFEVDLLQGDSIHLPAPLDGDA